MKIGDFLVKIGDFLVKIGDFLVKIGDFLVKIGDFLAKFSALTDRQIFSASESVPALLCPGQGLEMIAFN